MDVNCTINHTCLQGILTADIDFENNGISVIITPIISNDVKQILEICLQIVLFMTTSLFGIVTNIINITVYWKQGLKDSITLAFFGLSISDLFVVIMTFATSCCYTAKAILPHSNIDFPSVHYVMSAALRTMGYSISCMLTTFLSLERCCCVVLPFKVKYIFTRSRTATIMVSILVIHVICYIPFISSQQLRWKPYMTVNGTKAYKLRVHFLHYRPTVERIIHIIMGIFSPTVSQIIVTVCAITLTNGLRASSRFRKAMQPAKDRRIKESSLGDEKSTKDTDDENHGTLSNRDSRLVKAVIFLVLLMSVSNVPLLTMTYARSFIPDLNIGKPYQNIYSTGYSIVYVLSSLNASLNIFVYYRTSAKYKEIFNSLFRISK